MSWPKFRISSLERRDETPELFHVILDTVELRMKPTKALPAPQREGALHMRCIFAALMVTR
jgi:hypothetical protein